MTARGVCLFLVVLMTMTIICGACSGGGNTTPSETPDLASIPLGDVLANGKPTLAEFGWKDCIPCKQMKPILEELATEYQDRLNVVIVEVYDHMDLTGQYQIMTIPTQIVFDANGNEVGRHIGLWPKEAMISQLEKIGML